MIDVEEDSIALLVKCTTLFVLIVDRTLRFLSNLLRTDRFTAGTVIRRRNLEGSNSTLLEPRLMLSINKPYIRDQISRPEKRALLFLIQYTLSLGHPEDVLSF